MAVGEISPTEGLNALLQSTVQGCLGTPLRCPEYQPSQWTQKRTQPSRKVTQEELRVHRSCGQEEKEELRRQAVGKRLGADSKICIQGKQISIHQVIRTSAR